MLLECRSDRAVFVLLRVSGKIKKHAPLNTTLGHKLTLNLYPAVWSVGISMVAFIDLISTVA